MSEAEAGLDEWFEVLDLERRLALLEHATHQAEVQPAHDVLVLLGDLQEGTVADRDPQRGGVADDPRLEPEAVETPHQDVQGVVLGRPAPAALGQGQRP
jgi:hypothetical protein